MHFSDLDKIPYSASLSVLFCLIADGSSGDITFNPEVCSPQLQLLSQTSHCHVQKFLLLQ